MTFNWNRSEVLALAKEGCAHCQGFGLREKIKAGATPSPCKCVLRSVFRACYRRFRFCAMQEKYVSRVRLEQVNGKDQKQTWGMKNEEFMADFIVLTRKTLSEEEYRLFRFHYLLGADWKLCCRRLKIDRGSFFHAIYRLEQILGQAYREVTPYALFPIDEYFGGTVRKEPQRPDRVLQMPSPARRDSLRPPLRKIA